MVLVVWFVISCGLSPRIEECQAIPVVAAFENVADYVQTI
jgi:hypothetical protein